jgi:hypothetical protein
MKSDVSLRVDGVTLCMAHVGAVAGVGLVPACVVCIRLVGWARLAGVLVWSVVIRSFDDIYRARPQVVICTWCSRSLKMSNDWRVVLVFVVVGCL